MRNHPSRLLALERYTWRQTPSALFLGPRPRHPGPGTRLIVLPGGEQRSKHTYLAFMQALVHMRQGTPIPQEVLDQATIIQWAERDQKPWCHYPVAWLLEED